MGAPVRDPEATPPVQSAFSLTFILPALPLALRQVIILNKFMG